MSLDAVRDKLLAESRRRADAAARRMTADLKRTAPVDTGKTKRATGVRLVGDNGKKITAIAEIDTDYAEFVIYPTRPHVIRPRNRKALSFNWPKRGGTVVFAKVNHPGTTGNEFFQRVVDKWGDYLRAS